MANNIKDGGNVSFFRTNKRENTFIQVDKFHVDYDDRISWKEKGMMTYLLGKPDNWTILVKDLINRSKDGESAVYTGINSLIKCGYIERVEHRDKGKFSCIEYKISEIPSNLEGLSDDAISYLVRNRFLSEAEAQDHCRQEGLTVSRFSPCGFSARGKSSTSNNNKSNTKKIERERADDEISAISQHLENKCNGKTLAPVTPEVAEGIIKNLAVSYPQDKIVRAMDNIGSYPEKIENVYSFLDRAIKYAIAPKQQKPKVHDNQSSKQTQFTHQPPAEDLSVQIAGLRKSPMFMEEYNENADFANRVMFIQKKLKLPQEQAYVIVPELDKVEK